jgi:RNA polymerase sigma factor (sigma-70 family)
MNTPPDKEAFLRLVEENKRIIFKICNCYCPKKEDRDDLAQEIVYQLWKSFDRFDPGFKFSTWMYRVALNVAISFYRKEKRSAAMVVYPESLMELEESSDDPVEAERNISLLQQFIAVLKEIDRSIIILYLEEKSYKEIAEIIGLTETNVATRINRIKETLRNNFSKFK